MANSPYYIFNTFHVRDLILNSATKIESTTSHIFNPTLLSYLNSFSDEPSSFSTFFVFNVIPCYHKISPEGLALAISPTSNLSFTLRNQFLNIFNLMNNDQAINNIISIELDTIENKDFDNINNSHVDIDLNGLNSIIKASSSYPSNSFA